MNRSIPRCAACGVFRGGTAKHLALAAALCQSSEPRRTDRTAQARPLTTSAGNRISAQRWHAGSIANYSLPGNRWERRAGHDRGLRRRAYRIERAGAADPLGAEAGGSRPSGGRSCPRLQPHSGGDQAFDREDAGTDYSPESTQRAAPTGLESRSRGGAYQADAGVQPAAAGARGEWECSCVGYLSSPAAGVLARTFNSSQTRLTNWRIRGSILTSSDRSS